MFEKHQTLRTILVAQNRYILLLALLALIIQMVLWQLEIRYWPVSGDEQFYLMCAKQIYTLFSDNIAGDHSTITMRLNAITADGWFLPGMSILLQPALLLGFDLPYIRLYMLLVNFALTLAIAWRLTKYLPAPTGLVWIIIMLLSPATVLFSSTLWGEALAGKLYLLLLIEIYLALASKNRIGMFAVVSGLMLSIIIYIRPNFIILSPLLVVGFFYYQWRYVNFSHALIHAGRFGFIAALITGLTLLPWQIAIYQKFGEFFVTTTSVELNAIIAYTDKTYTAQKPDGYSIFMQRHSLVMDELNARAKSTNQSYGTVLRDERKRVFSSLTLERYIEVTKNNLFEFFLDENEMLFRFQRITDSSSMIKKPLYRTLRKLNTLSWYSLLAATFLLFFVSARSPMTQWLSIMAKLSIVLLCTQCFMSIGGARYYIQLIPLMALLVALYVGTCCDTHAKKTV